MSFFKKIVCLVLQIFSLALCLAQEEESVTQETTASSKSGTSPLVSIFIIVIIALVIYKIVKTHKAKNKEKPEVLSDDQSLPIVDSCVILHDDEVCHFCQDAKYRKVKNLVVGHKSTSSGSSAKFFDGFYSHSGSTESRTIRDDVEDYCDGKFTITNKRIIFTGDKWAFDRKIKDLTAINPFSNALSLQFGDTPYVILTTNAEYAYKILSRVINEDGEKEDEPSHED